MSCVSLDLAPDSRIPPGLRILNGDNHQPQCVPTDHATIQSAVFTMKFMSCQEDNYVNKTRSKWSIDAIKTDMISTFDIWVLHLNPTFESDIWIHYLNPIFEFNI